MTTDRESTVVPGHAFGMTWVSGVTSIGCRMYCSCGWIGDVQYGNAKASTIRYQWIQHLRKGGLIR